MLLKSKVAQSVGLILISALSFVSFAKQNDIKQVSQAELSLKDLPVVHHHSFNNRAKAQFSLRNNEDFPQVELVVFYQPSYAATYGEYAMHKRIPIFVDTLNEAISAHGLEGYKVVIKDVVPVKSVPDSVSYTDVLDKDGNVIQDGADYLFSLSALNEMSLVSGKWIENHEYQVYQEKWSADLVLYMREKRQDDGTLLGLAGIGGESSSALDDGGDPSLYTAVAHELGHNFGMNHEEEKANVGPDYARAWKCGGKNTIMYSASSPESTVRHFSDPSLMNGNENCGDESIAYNAKVLTDNYMTIAQRRSGLVADGVVNFVSSSFSGNESEGITLHLERSGDASESASVKVFAENGSAVWGEDFSNAFVLAEFPEGSSKASVVFPVINDGGTEGVEEFKVHLHYPYKLSVGDLASATARLLDGNNSGIGGMLSISAPNELNEGQKGTLLISRNGGVGEIIVNVTTGSDSALPGVDYVPINKQLVFAEGEVEKSVEFIASDDLSAEVTEVVEVTISSPNEGVTYSPNIASISVIDDDAVGVGAFEIRSGDNKVQENIGNVPVVISRKGGFDAVDLEVEIDVKGVKTSLPISFLKDESEKSILINISDNAIDEPDYELKLTLNSKDGTAITVNEFVLVVIDNDESTTAEPPVNESSSGGSIGFLVIFLLPFTFLRRLKVNSSSRI